MAFVDETKIAVSSGHGGAGAVSFRREKYVPRGGPDGGDGGRGGDVIIVVKDNLRTLSHLHVRRSFKADDGSPGTKRKRHGKDGASIVVPVPPGTFLRNAETGKLIQDMTDRDELVLLRGGRGGQGNARFATSTHQAPRFAQPGMPGATLMLTVELNLVADVGFVGYPNAGKSTLLSALTNANPKVGAYPFTTIIPNLGVMKMGYREIVLADMPGLLEGASTGVGLGIQFLKHINRTRAIAVLVDLSDETWVEHVPVLLGELEEYDPALLSKPRVIVGTKLDIVEAQIRFPELCRSLPHEDVIGVSAATRTGLGELAARFVSLLPQTSKEQP